MVEKFNFLQKRLGRILVLDYIDNDTLQFTYPHMGTFIYHGKTGKMLEVVDRMAEDEDTDSAQYMWYLMNDYVRDDKGHYHPRENMPVEVG